MKVLPSMDGKVPTSNVESLNAVLQYNNLVEILIWNMEWKKCTVKRWCAVCVLNQARYIYREYKQTLHNGGRWRRRRQRQRWDGWQNKESTFPQRQRSLFANGGMCSLSSVSNFPYYLSSPTLSSYMFFTATKSINAYL